jgi:hypothetical protein
MSFTRSDYQTHRALTPRTASAARGAGPSRSRPRRCCPSATRR